VRRHSALRQTVQNCITVVESTENEGGYQLLHPIDVHVTSDGARVLVALGKRLRCRPHPCNQISNCYSYGYNDGISDVDCEQYDKLRCKISEFNIFALQMPSLHSAARGG